MTASLINAAISGDLAGVRAALANGGDTHRLHAEALNAAATHGHHLVVDCLIDAGADVHNLNDEPLLRAARNGHHQVLDRLLAAGANVHAAGDLALRAAARNDRRMVIDRLLRAGADAGLAASQLANDGYPEAAQSLRPHYRHWQAAQVGAAAARGVDGPDASHDTDLGL